MLDNSSLNIKEITRVCKQNNKFLIGIFLLYRKFFIIFATRKVRIHNNVYRNTYRVSPVMNKNSDYVYFINVHNKK